jgi:hypothetical protein
MYLARVKGNKLLFARTQDQLEEKCLSHRGEGESLEILDLGEVRDLARKADLWDHYQELWRPF